jgi:uncharacterized protein (TIGR03067 family)
MRKLFATCASVGFLLLCLHAFAGEDKKLQGAWEVTELIVGGMKVPEKDIAGMKFVFKDKTLTIVPANADTGVVDKRTFSIDVDPTKNPATVNLTALDGEFKGTKSPGIYEVKGDVLRWCQSDDPKSAERPKTFASPEKSSIYMFTFKRSK